MTNESTIDKLKIHTYESSEVYEAAKEAGLLKDGEIHLIPDDDDVNYEELDNLPSVNGVVVKGKMTAKELGLQEAMSEISTTELIELWNGIMNE